MADERLASAGAARVIREGDAVARSNHSRTNIGIFYAPRAHRVLRVVDGQVPIAEIICTEPPCAGDLPHWPYWVALADLFHVDEPA